MTEITLSPFKDSKFIEPPFEGEFLEAVIKTVGDKQTTQVVWLFKNPAGEEPLEFTDWGFDKISANRQERNISDFSQIGVTASCLGKGYIHKQGDKKITVGGYGIQYIIDPETRQVKFKPPIAHKTIRLTPLEEGKTTSKDGEKKYKAKIAVEIIDPTTPQPPPTTQPTPPTITPVIWEQWEDFLVNHLKEPRNITGIHKLMIATVTDAKVREPLTKVRTQVIQAIMKEGFKKYPDKVLDLDADGKYSVVG